jgi:hypothetical protein
MSNKTWIKIIVPVVMSFFFFRNLVYVATHNMDSWMGGGMRMFGKTDKMLYRIGGFEVRYNNEVHFVNIKDIKDLRVDSQMIRILPSERRLNKLLAKIRAMSWCYDTASASFVTRGGENCDPVAGTDIIAFRVYKLNYEHEGNRVFFSELASTDTTRNE